MSIKIVGSVWFLIITTALLVGCYFWYTRVADKTSRIFSIIVPLLVIPTWGYLTYKCVILDDCDDGEQEGGRRKRKLR